MAAITVPTPWLQNFTAIAVQPEVARGVTSAATPLPLLQ